VKPDEKERETHMKEQNIPTDAAMEEAEFMLRHEDGHPSLEVVARVLDAFATDHVRAAVAEAVKLERAHTVETCAQICAQMASTAFQCRRLDPEKYEMLQQVGQALTEAARTVRARSK